MVGIIQASRRHVLSMAKTLIPHFHQRFAHRPANRIISKFPPINTFSTSSLQHFESNLVRMLTNEIEFDSEYTPPYQGDGLFAIKKKADMMVSTPSTCNQTEKKFNAFMVEDRPGEQFVTLRGRSTIDENIKIEATMFDGVSPSMDEDSEPNGQLHISVLVDILKVEGGDMLEFVCSAWPERLEIQKIYVIGIGGTLSRPYIGPDFRVLDKTLQSAMYEFLNARGVNNDLSSFLHRYVWNKDKVEHIQRLKLLKSCFER